ncbi:MAG: DUF2848 domain-containing protein [Proteobacteria bacterium]|nr:DUF2848 domain-containing protein [Pseudomonadota bacterium]MCH8188069.1 DUF2848 domain-containing protein [Pseudomonadota bacterium]
MPFILQTAAGASPVELPIGDLVIAGWTGRDEQALEKHIRELEDLGVARPKSTPIFYRVASSLLTTRDEIEVAGADSSGEVEFVLYGTGQGLLVGLGSDHTDRKAETVGITLAKQMCAKPVSETLWRYDDVADHWDKLILRSWLIDGGRRIPYQEGAVTTMRAPDDLIRRYAGGDKVLPQGTAMFCGTLAVKGEIRGGPEFELELDDPVLGRTITHRYRIVPLPIAG